MKLMVFGAGGMLGRDVIQAAEAAGHELVAAPPRRLTWSDAAAVADAVASRGPTSCFNCAACTDVDGAEPMSRRRCA